MENRELKLSKSTSLSYNIFIIEGDLTITSLLKVTTELSRHIAKDNPKDMVLDLSKITYLDSSGIRTLVNLKKQLESKERNIYLLTPSDEIISILKQTNLDKVFTIIDSIKILEKKASENIFKTLIQYADEDQDGWYKIKCSCPVCGSKSVEAYIIDENSIEWYWDKDDPFPIAKESLTGKPAGYFSMLPIVCTECNMATTDLKRFNVIDSESEIVIKSDLDLEQKNLLLKSVKKRKEMLDLGEKIGEDFFKYPRERIAVYKAFELAAFTTQTLAISRKDIGSFDIGLIHFLAIRFAEHKLIDNHISSGRTWMTQALKDEGKLTTIQQAISNFSMMVFNINIKKTKEAAEYFTKMKELRKSLPESYKIDSFNSPSFWYEQAFVIWGKEIESQSNAFNV